MVRKSVPSDNVRLNRGIDMATSGCAPRRDLTSRLLAFSRRQPLEPSRSTLMVGSRQYGTSAPDLGETIELEGVLARG